MYIARINITHTHTHTHTYIYIYTDTYLYTETLTSESRTHFVACETPIVFISFRKTNIETLIHVNVNHATFVPVKKYSWLNKYSIKLDSGRNDFIQISAVKPG
jgi:hypothetical protein